MCVSVCVCVSVCLSVYASVTNKSADMVGITYMTELEHKLLRHVMTFSKIWPLTSKGHHSFLPWITLLLKTRFDMVDITYIKELENELLFHMMTFTEIWPLTLKGHFLPWMKFHCLNKVTSCFCKSIILFRSIQFFPVIPRDNWKKRNVTEQNGNFKRYWHTISVV